jgi:hypothetical protein
MRHSCKRKALTRVATGDAAPPWLETHLVECAPCRNDLARMRELLDRVDCELGALATAEPSPGMAARIRAQVATEPLGHGRPFWASVALAAGGVASLVVVSGWILDRQQQSPGVSLSVVVPRSVEVPVPPSPNAGAGSSGIDEEYRGSTTQGMRPRADIRRRPVQLPPNNARARQSGVGWTPALLNLSEQSRADPLSTLPAPSTESLPEPKGLRISSLSITPLLVTPLSVTPLSVVRPTFPLIEPE